jgi:hypothetical protein
LGKKKEWIRKWGIGKDRKEFGAKEEKFRKKWL